MNADAMVRALERYYRDRYADDHRKVMVRELARRVLPAAMEELMNQCYAHYRRLPNLADVLKAGEADDLCNRVKALQESRARTVEARIESCGICAGTGWIRVRTARGFAARRCECAGGG